MKELATRASDMNDEIAKLRGELVEVLGRALYRGALLGYPDNQFRARWEELTGRSYD